MKLNRYLLALVAMASLLLTATTEAQGSTDLFGAPRTLVLTTPKLISGAAAGITTNGPFDTHGYIGIAKIDFMHVTNANGGTMTATLEMSANATNGWVALTNFALATSTTITYTNSSDTNQTASDVFLLPGTFVTPTASSAGFATTYLNPAAFTNTGAITVTANGIYEVGYSIDDALRYLHVVWTPGGTATNSSVAAVLTGRRSAEVK